MDQAPLVQMLDSTIQLISIWETNCTIHWIEIYPVDSTIHLLNNRGQDCNKSMGRQPPPGEVGRERLLSDFH